MRRLPDDELLAEYKWARYTLDEVDNRLIPYDPREWGGASRQETSAELFDRCLELATIIDERHLAYPA